MTKTKDDNAKTFSLKPIEQQMLEVLRTQYFGTLSQFLSFIALERLAYQVTEYTRFEVDDDKLNIKEVEPEKPKEEVAV